MNSKGTVEPENTPINPKEEIAIIDSNEEHVRPSESIAASSAISDSDDSDNVEPPAAGMSLLDQIAVVEHKDNLKKLGISHREKKIKPLVANKQKKNELMGTQRVLPSNKLGQSTTDKMMKKPELPKKQVEAPSPEVLAHRERLENERLLEVLNRAFHAQIITKSAENLEYEDQEINDKNATIK